MALNIAFLPSAVQAVIQDGILKGRFLDSLTPQRRWRTMCERVRHEGKIGEKVTKTRPGLIAPSAEADVEIPAGQDPGLATRSIEQFTYEVKSKGKGLDIHLPASFFAQASTFLDDSEKLAMHGELTLDGICRDRVVKAYGGGNTFTTAAQGGGGSVTVGVQDTTGFEKVLVNGVPTAISATNPLPAKIGSTAVNVTGLDAAAKTLTIAVAATWSQYDAVVADDAPTVIRQTSRATDRLIVAGDTATIATFRDAKRVLVDHFVPEIAPGVHGCYISAKTKNQLFVDAEFHDAIRAQGVTEQFKTGMIGDYAGIRFFELPQERMPANLSGSPYQTTIQRSFMFGADLCVEAYVPEEEFAQEASPMEVAGQNHVKMRLDGEGVLTMIYRGPLDRLGRIVGAAWVANIDYVVPTDAKGISGAQRYKRGVMVHTAG